MKNKFLVMVMFMSLVGMSNTSYAVPVAVTDASGLLHGIDGIDVLNKVYNVRFVEGSFNTLFGNELNLTFHDGADAFVASYSLLEVFSLAPSFAQYNVDPRRINGIDGNATFGIIATPYRLNTFGNVEAGLYLNEPAGSNPHTASINTNWSNAQGDSGSSSIFVYAEWTEVATIPVPAAVWLMGSGLLGLMGFSRKRSQVAA